MSTDAPGSNIAETLFRELRGQILRGDLKPGDRLPGERELAQRHDTNRNTLREAVRKLEQARLVTVRHGQGVTVADFRRTGTMELLPAWLETGPPAGQVVQLLEDLLPARVLVLEYAARLAARRADRADLERLADITDLLSTAVDRADPVVIARGFQLWLEALIDAGHSVSARWVANPFLEAYRELLDRFPSLWIVDPRFTQHLRTFHGALHRGDEAGAVQALRGYYAGIDAEFVRMLQASRPTASAPPSGAQAAPAPASTSEPEAPPGVEPPPRSRRRAARG